MSSVSFHEVPVELISTGLNVRQDFQGIDELAQSISEVGLIQPIAVSRTDDGYRLIAGERRLRACLSLGMDSVICRVYEDVSDDELFGILVSENYNRSDLNPIEEAEAFRRLSSMGYTQERIGQLVGRSQEFVANRLRLLNLPEKIVPFVKSGELTPSHALKFLSLSGSPAYDDLVDYFARNNLAAKCGSSKDFSQYLASLIYSAVPEGTWKQYVHIFNVGEEFFNSRCSSCPNHIGSYCYYNADCCRAAIDAESARQSAERETVRSGESRSSQASRDLRAFIKDSMERVNEDVRNVVTQIPVEELYSRFSYLIFECDFFTYNFDSYLRSRGFGLPDEDDDFDGDDDTPAEVDLVEPGKLPDDAEEDASCFLPSLEEFIRLIVEFSILCNCNVNGYTSNASVIPDYFQVLRDHGLKSGVFDKASVASYNDSMDGFRQAIKESEIQ